MSDQMTTTQNYPIKGEDDASQLQEDAETAGGVPGEPEEAGGGSEEEESGGESEGSGGETEEDQHPPEEPEG